ncbi:hypothetical protein HK102_011279, partial [Quaeritorhiza haematococci]
MSFLITGDNTGAFNPFARSGGPIKLHNIFQLSHDAEGNAYLVTSAISNGKAGNDDKDCDKEWSLTLVNKRTLKAFRSSFKLDKICDLGQGIKIAPHRKGTERKGSPTADDRRVLNVNAPSDLETSEPTAALPDLCEKLAASLQNGEFHVNCQKNRCEIVLDHEANLPIQLELEPVPSAEAPRIVADAAFALMESNTGE